MDRNKIVLKAMKKAGRPVRVGRIVELTGLKQKEVDRAMKALRKEELITQLKMKYWLAK